MLFRSVVLTLSGDATYMEKANDALAKLHGDSDALAKAKKATSDHVEAQKAKENAEASSESKS